MAIVHIVLNAITVFGVGMDCNRVLFPVAKFVAKNIGSASNNVFVYFRVLYFLIASSSYSLNYNNVSNKEIAI